MPDTELYCLIHHYEKTHPAFTLIPPSTRQTGMYYLRTKAAVNAIQYTVEKGSVSSNSVPIVDESDVCLSCQS